MWIINPYVRVTAVSLIIFKDHYELHVCAYNTHYSTKVHDRKSIQYTLLIVTKQNKCIIQFMYVDVCCFGVGATLNEHVYFFALIRLN